MEEEKVKGIYAWEWFSARAHGPHALFWLSLVSFLEPIVLPIIPEGLMVAMILAGRERWKKYAAITTIASTLGGVAGYFIGAFLFKEFGAAFLTRYELHYWFGAVRALFEGSVFAVMLFITFTPIPDKIFVILAGFFHVPLIPYVLGFFLGRALRFGFVAYLVHLFGGHVFAVVRKYFKVLAVIVVLVIAYAFMRAFHIAGL